MSEKESLDILGIQPIAKAAEKATSAAVDGISAVLSRICLPAAEEYGLWFRDRVHHWRTQNLAVIVQATERKLAETGAAPGVHAHPRLVGAILSEGSWIDDSEVQEMWAGLLSSSCSESGDDDSNLLFVNLLSGLTKMQAKILRYACERSEKAAAPNGLIFARDLAATLQQLVELTGQDDVHRLDRELDHLRALELLEHGGFDVTDRSLVAHLTPTSLALHMYVRCEGSRCSPPQYFNLSAATGTDPK